MPTSRARFAMADSPLCELASSPVRAVSQSNRGLETVTEISRQHHSCARRASCEWIARMGKGLNTSPTIAIGFGSMLGQLPSLIRDLYGIATPHHRHFAADGQPARVLLFSGTRSDKFWSGHARLYVS